MPLETWLHHLPPAPEATLTFSTRSPAKSTLPTSIPVLLVVEVILEVVVEEEAAAAVVEVTFVVTV